MRYYRKVITIRAEDSPNVKRELLRQQGAPQGEWPDEVPGVLSWDEYQKRRATWDAVRQCVGLDAQFHEGAENRLFPPAWLAASARRADELRDRPAPAAGLGIDPGEGTANTAFAVVSREGLLELVSEKTADTSVIAGKALALARKHNLPDSAILFDAGGGGVQIADHMRASGRKVRTVRFGAAVDQEFKRTKSASAKSREERYAYVNKRAQVYWELRLLLDPADGAFAIPSEHTELRRQLSLMPLLYDREGRVRMLPKSKRDPRSTEQTLTQLLGCSPDESDALVLACHAMLHPRPLLRIGAMW